MANLRMARGIAGTLLAMALLAFGAAPALADADDAPDGPALDEGDVEGGASRSPEVHDGEIPDYNDQSLVLDISMAMAQLTLEPGSSTSVSCVISPHQGVLHTRLYGTLVYDATAVVSSSDPTVVRAAYDLESDTLYLEAYEPGASVVTVSASLVYADPVSASVEVTVPAPPGGGSGFDDFVDGGAAGSGQPGGSGGADAPDEPGAAAGGDVKEDRADVADSNVAGADAAGEGAQVAPSAPPDADAAAPSAATSSAAATAEARPMPAPMPEAKAGSAATPDGGPSASSFTLYQLEEAANLPDSEMPDVLPAGLAAGVGLAALALVALGGGETYYLFRRRLA